MKRLHLTLEHAWVEFPLLSNIEMSLSFPSPNQNQNRGKGNKNVLVTIELQLRFGMCVDHAYFQQTHCLYPISIVIRRTCNVNFVHR